jgi:hypothetical protein
MSLHRWLIVLAVFVAGSVAVAQEGRVKLLDNRLYVDGEPFFPYGCWGCIESVASMKRHHFTCVFSGMKGVPDLLAQAAEQDFLVITYPNAPSWGKDHEDHVMTVREHPNLLAWNIGDDLVPKHVEKVHQAYDFIRANDPLGRPIMLDVVGGFAEYTWFDEMFCAYTYPLVKKPTLLDYQQLLRDRHEIIGRDKFLWTWAQAHVQVWYTQKFLNPDVHWMPSLYPDGENLRMVAYSALAAGCRGIMWFLASYFTEEYHGTDRYAEAALIGCELEVIGPWLAEGTVGPELETSDPTLHAYPVEFPGGTLILLMCIKDDTQYHVDEAEVANATLELGRPLEPEERVYELTLMEGARDVTDEAPADHAGALRVPSFQVTGLMLITDDADLAASADQKCEQLLPDSSRYAALAAAAKLDKVTQVINALEQAGYPQQRVWHLRALARAAEMIHRQANDSIERAQFASAFSHARAARGILRKLVYDEWRRLNENEYVRDTDILPNFYLAEEYYPVIERLESAEPSENLIPNSSFEEGDGAAATGCLAAQAAHEQEGKRARSDEHARTGRYSLRLASESPAIYEGQEWDWVTAELRSPPIEAQQWDGIRAEAWVHLPEDLQKTERGALINLMAFDAEGKPVAGWKATDIEVGRAQATEGWHRLSLRGLITHPGAVTVAVRLGMCGVGRCYFDDILLVRLRPR